MLRTNGWTGGQYSVLRVIFGLYLFVHFVQHVPWGTEMFSRQGARPDGAASPLPYLFPNILALNDSPLMVTVLLLMAAGLSLLFCAGWHDRVAALILLWYIAACLFGRNPLIANPSLPYVGWLLLAHMFLPPAPYGSWAARHRPDPGTHWRMPQPIYAVAWIVLAVGYSYSGYTKWISPSWIDGTALAKVWANPPTRPTMLSETLLTMPADGLKLATWTALAMELLFAPLSLIRRVRPWLWLSAVFMHSALITLINFADLSLGMLMVHGLTFDPAWIGRRKASQPDTLFYDGHCGLCHRTVRFVLAEDPEGTLFRFAPLQSDTFRQTLPEARRKSLPDSVVIYTADGRIMTRSTAVLRILDQLGGLWRILGRLIGWIPASLRDAAYDGIARIRHRLFQPPPEACPLVPEPLRRRFGH